MEIGISHIMKDFGDKNVGLQWISNPISCDVYGFTDSEKQHNGINLFPTSVSVLTDETFDLVFLWRSDTWTPPHLDYGFEELVTTCLHHFENVIIENDVKEPRNIATLVKQLKMFSREREIVK